VLGRAVRNRRVEPYAPPSLPKLIAGAVFTGIVLFVYCYGFLALEIAFQRDCAPPVRAPVCTLHVER
jgi:hypothetical protein